jgi:hypothetical protein
LNGQVEYSQVSSPTCLGFSTVNRIIEQGAGYGSSNVGEGQRVLLEFVSANPTGPLHVGHGRGAAYGATVANPACLDNIIAIFEAKSPWVLSFEWSSRIFSGTFSNTPCVFNDTLRLRVQALLISLCLRGLMRRLLIVLLSRERAMVRPMWARVSGCYSRPAFSTIPTIPLIILVIALYSFLLLFLINPTFLFYGYR